MQDEILYTNKEKLIERLTELASKGDYVFRGYSIQEQMMPNILRNNVDDIEIDLLYEFEKYASQYINANNPIDFMSYAQHFGLSTRLLDFTYNPFVALYFALFKNKPHNSKYVDDRTWYYIRYCNIHENLFLHEIPIKNEGEFFKSSSMAETCKKLIDTVDIIYNDKEYTSLLGKRSCIETISRSIRSSKSLDEVYKEIENKIDSKSIMLIDPNQSNQRLVMQQGLFMFCYAINENEHKEIVDNNTQVIKIHKELREELQTYLNTIGINAFRLMPDLASVCEAVERQVKEKRAKDSHLFKKKERS